MSAAAAAAAAAGGDGAGAGWARGPGQGQATFLDLQVVLAYECAGPIHLSLKGRSRAYCWTHAQAAQPTGLTAGVWILQPLPWLRLLFLLLHRCLHLLCEPDLHDTAQCQGAILLSTGPLKKPHKAKTFVPARMGLRLTLQCLF
eukprot:1158530-Pelagomonas_calceolata.AAC.10